MSSNLLAELLEAFDHLPGEERLELEAKAVEETAGMLWLPNPGPQTEAVECLADELFYGGQAGGGKTDVILGLALTDHERSLVLRRQNSDTTGIVDRLAEILGHRNGLNNSVPKQWRLPGHTIDIGGCQHEHDKQKFKGKPHSFIGFDEISDFTESQYRFIIAWNRSAKPGERSRVVAAGNPPTTPEGLWVLKYWGAWLDPNHPNPAKPGELRWYTTINGEDVECAGPELIEVDGEMIAPRSRTFIRSTLADNPDLAATNYDSTLAALPAELRDAYRSGKFDVTRADKPMQLIPTAHIVMAQERWRPDGGEGIPMTCLGNDVALGGGDYNTYARRHGLWFDEIIKELLRGKAGEVDPIDLAARNISLMRDGCDVVIDMTGGWGSGVYSHLKNNVEGIKLHAHVGSDGSGKRSRDGKLKFYNKRAETHWLLREALEPGLGQAVALPPDPELLADLAALTWKMTPRGIVVIEKADLKKVLGRSPDKGDAVVMAWNYGEPAVQTTLKLNMLKQRGGGVRVNTGHANRKRGRR